MKLKNILTLSSIFFANMAMAADWTPVFKSFENGCADSKILTTMIDQNIWNRNTTSPQNFVRTTALKGQFPTVALPYKNDMQPVQSKLSQQGERYIEVTVPLKNATYYGVPLKAFTVYSGTDSGLAGRSLVFAALNASQLQRLKQIKFKAETEMGFKAELMKNDRKETILLCDVSM